MVKLASPLQRAVVVERLRQVASHRRFICKGNVILEMVKWHPIGGWLLIRRAAHSRLHLNTM